MTKSSDQSDTKSVLLDAAILEIAEKGWGGLRTRDVAERAKVNKALVHYHFGSMHNLRQQAIAMLLGGVVNESAALLIEAETLADGIRAFGSALDSFRSDDPRGVVLMEAMIHVPREEFLEEMMGRALDFYETALRQRIEADLASGSIDPGTDPAGLARALTATLDGLALHAYMRPEVDFESAAAALADILESSNTTRTASE